MRTFPVVTEQFPHPSRTGASQGLSPGPCADRPITGRKTAEAWTPRDQNSGARILIISCFRTRGRQAGRRRDAAMGLGRFSLAIPSRTLALFYVLLLQPRAMSSLLPQSLMNGIDAPRKMGLKMLRSLVHR